MNKPTSEMDYIFDKLSNNGKNPASEIIKRINALAEQTQIRAVNPPDDGLLRDSRNRSKKHSSKGSKRARNSAGDDRDDTSDRILDLSSASDDDNDKRHDKRRRDSDDDNDKRHDKRRRDKHHRTAIATAADEDEDEVTANGLVPQTAVLTWLHTDSLNTMHPPTGIPNALPNSVPLMRRQPPSKVVTKMTPEEIAQEQAAALRKSIPLSKFGFGMRFREFGNENSFGNKNSLSKVPLSIRNTTPYGITIVPTRLPGSRVTPGATVDITGLHPSNFILVSIDNRDAAELSKLKGAIGSMRVSVLPDIQGQTVPETICSHVNTMTPFTLNLGTTYKDAQTGKVVHLSVRKILLHGVCGDGKQQLQYCSDPAKASKYIFVDKTLPACPQQALVRPITRHPETGTIICNFSSLVTQGAIRDFYERKKIEKARKEESKLDSAN